MDETCDFAHFVNNYHHEMLHRGYALQDSTGREAWYFRSAAGAHQTVTLDIAGIYFRILHCVVSRGGDILEKSETFFKPGGPYAATFTKKV